MYRSVQGCWGPATQRLRKGRGLCAAKRRGERGFVRRGAHEALAPPAEDASAYPPRPPTQPSERRCDPLCASVREAEKGGARQGGAWALARTTRKVIWCQGGALPSRPALRTHVPWLRRATREKGGGGGPTAGLTRETAGKKKCNMGSHTELAFLCRTTYAPPCAPSSPHASLSFFSATHSHARALARAQPRTHAKNGRRRIRWGAPGRPAAAHPHRHGARRDVSVPAVEGGRGRGWGGRTTAKTRSG